MNCPYFSFTVEVREDRLGGLGLLPKQGIYLAGTTTSRDLPAAGGAYHGGETDGFVAYLDPLTAVPPGLYLYWWGWTR
ncbi:MAG: hypothetical protein QM757_05135 [Paludibaculum sp.]